MDIDYRLIRSRKRKKTIAVRINRQGTVEVLAPDRLPQSEIEAFLDRKKSWINRKTAEFHARKGAAPSLQMDRDVHYLGERYPLFSDKTLPMGKPGLHWDGTAFHLYCREAGDRRALLARWYASQAKVVFPGRVFHHGKIMGVFPSAVRITSARYRFGSCSVAKRISLSWRLLMAPWWVIDSVIIHELSHLTELNHSSRFWCRVRTFCPDYEQGKIWLVSNGHRLAEF
jgi:predicted metal-dependent hydrolase